MIQHFYYLILIPRLLVVSPSALSVSGKPTTKPTPPNYGNGPFVSLSSSSEIVTIPRPVAPSLDEPRTDCPHLEIGLLSWHDAATWTSVSATMPTYIHI